MSWVRRVVATDRGRVWSVLLVVALVRLIFLWQHAMADEAGFLLVGRAWGHGGPNLYGRYWVDRPPGLIALFALADHIPVLRAIALVFAVAFVALVAHVSRRVGGSATWGAVAAGCLAVTPVIQASNATGELFAIPLVTAAVAAVVESVRASGLGRTRAAYAWGAGAGVAAMLAVSVKQNFVDGFVFALVLLVALGVRRELAWRRVLTTALAGVAGALVVVLAMVAVGASSPVGVSGLWYAVAQFRADAAGVIAHQSRAAPARRAQELVVAGLVTGLVPVLAVLAWRAGRARLRGSAFAWAIGLTVPIELAAVVAGGSYWLHYLIQLAPMTALALGRWAPASRVLRALAVLVTVSAVVAVATDAYAVAGGHDRGGTTGRWIAAAGRPGDTATVLYGHAEVQLATGMRSPYPYLWSLPMRTLDPRLDRLTRLLDGTGRPTWVVVWDTLNPWQIDARGEISGALAQHYREAGVVCGHQVWLDRDQPRTLAPVPSC